MIGDADTRDSDSHHSKYRDIYVDILIYISIHDHARECVAKPRVIAWIIVKTRNVSVRDTRVKHSR